MPVRGSCLCGAVVYEIDRLDMPIVHCHCRSCRKAHAAVYAPTAGVLREHFRILQGEDRLTGFVSSPGKTRHFCAVCGSPVYAARDGQPNVLLRLATLDGDPGPCRRMHIWRAHDVDWLADDAQTESHDEWHPGH